MILCVQIEKIGVCIKGLTPLMDRYQRGEVDFPDEAIKWIEQAEKTMSELRLPDGAEMSTLRGRVLKAEDALPASEGGRPLRSAVRRARNTAAAEAVDRAETVLRGRLVAAEERLKLFEDKLCEGMTAFLLQNALPPRSASRQNWLSSVLASLREFTATRPLSIYLSASLSKVDRLYIMDRVMIRLSDADVPPAAEPAA